MFDKDEGDGLEEEQEPEDRDESATEGGVGGRDQNGQTQTVPRSGGE